MNDMNHPKVKGIVTEERCKLYFLEHGYDVSVPIGDNAAYDMILDTGDRLIRLQCKHSIFRNGALSFEATKNVSSRTKSFSKKYTDDEIDAFCTEFNGTVYIVPFEDVVSVTLRLSYPRYPIRNSDSSSRLRWAKEYEADYVIGQMLGDPNYPKRDEESNFKKYLERNYTKYEPKNMYHWYTDGEINRRIAVGSEVPDRFYLGRAGKVNQFT